IGGSVGMALADPLIQKAARSVADQLALPETLVLQVPQSVLFLVQNQINEESFNGKLALLMNSEELAQIKAGAEALTPSARQQALADDIAEADFSRADGTAIPVFHLAALLDLARLNPALT